MSRAGNSPLPPAARFPEDLECRIVVPVTPRNPYAIRISEYAGAGVAIGAGAPADRGVVYSMSALEVALAGTKTVTAGGSSLTLRPGRAAAVLPGSHVVSESNGYASFIVFFNDRFPSDFLQQNFRTVPVPDGRAGHACGLGKGGLAWFSSAVRDVFAEPKYFPCMTRVLLQETFLRMTAQDPAVMGFLSTAALSGLGALSSFMADHAVENLSNKKLAELSGRSLSAFQREFSRVFHTTPQKWLMDRRLERARVLVTSTTMTITQICHETGFKDSAHFSRAFRRRFGTAPSAMRPRQSARARPADRRASG